jgi:hypothetical protein
MGLFSQDEDEETPRTAGPDFSGRPIEPDSEGETPDAVEPGSQQESPEVVPVDGATVYGKESESPEEEHRDLPIIDTDGDTGASQYAAPSQASDEEGDAYKPIAPPAPVSLSPFADHSADYAAMQAQKQAEAGENVKPSVGRKILAAVVRAGAGFEHGPREGIAAGQDVLNRPLTNAQQRWTRAESPIQARLTADQAQDAATQRDRQGQEQQGRINEQDYRNRIISQQDAARAKNFAAQAAAKNEGINGDGWKPDDPNNPLGGYSGTSIGGKPLHSAAPPKSVQLDPEYKIAAAAAKGTPFTTEQQQILRSGGKLTFRPPPNPRQANAEEQQWDAYVRSLGHAPTTQDVINFKRGTPGDNDPETVIAKNMQAKDAFINQWRRVGKDESTSSTPEGSYVSTDGIGRIMTGPEFNARVEKFRTDLNASTPMRKS